MAGPLCQVLYGICTSRTVLSSLTTKHAPCHASKQLLGNKVLSARRWL